MIVIKKIVTGIKIIKNKLFSYPCILFHAGHTFSKKLP
jgi:hypothetical protein